MSTRAAHYVRRHDWQHYAMPFTLEGVITGALFRPREGVLQRHFVDPILNAPFTPGRFEVAFSGFCTFAFVHFTGCRSADPAFGNSPYNEATLVCAVRDMLARERTLYWFTPAMFLDAFFPLLAGREIFGFPKILGAFEPLIPRHGDVRTLRVPAFPRFGADCDPRALLAMLDPGPFKMQAKDFTRINRENLPPDRFVDSFAAALRAFFEEIAPPEQKGLIEDVWQFFVTLLRGHAPGIFLKEFPAIHSHEQACYCALTTTRHRVLRFSEIHVHGRGRLEVGNPASNPLAECLGLCASGGAGGGIKPWAIASVHTVQEVLPGQELG